jgi:hypothetical protein
MCTNVLCENAQGTSWTVSSPVHPATFSTSARCARNSKRTRSRLIIPASTTSVNCRNLAPMQIQRSTLVRPSAAHTTRVGKAVDRPTAVGARVDVTNVSPGISTLSNPVVLAVHVPADVALDSLLGTAHRAFKNTCVLHDKLLRPAYGKTLKYEHRIERQIPTLICDKAADGLSSRNKRES